MTGVCFNHYKYVPTLRSFSSMVIEKSSKNTLVSWHMAQTYYTTEQQGSTRTKSAARFKTRSYDNVMFEVF